MARRVSLLSRLSAAYPDIERERLYARILSGEVFVDGERVSDPKRLVDRAASVAIKGGEFVSRGGSKLEAALLAWSVPVAGKVFIDAGSSTGGFTDCLLQHGARVVHAVDVGYNQIAYSLRNDPRVVLHERTNILSVDRLTPAADAAVADLSFRSIVGAVEHLLALTAEGWMIALVKPQFEMEAFGSPAESRGFRGVVGDAATREALLLRVVESLRANGLEVERQMASPLRGHKGNEEFLILVRRRG